MNNRNDFAVFVSDHREIRRVVAPLLEEYTNWTWPMLLLDIIGLKLVIITFTLGINEKSFSRL